MHSASKRIVPDRQFARYNLHLFQCFSNHIRLRNQAFYVAPDHILSCLLSSEYEISNILDATEHNDSIRCNFQPPTSNWNQWDNSCGLQS